MTTAAAILVRVWFPRAWNELETPASVFYQGDTRAFLAYASHLVAGVPFDHGVPFHPPGWPFVLSLFFRAMGFSPLEGRAADPALVKLFVATIGGLTVAVTTVLAARLAGTGAMLAAAMLGTFHFGHVVQGGVPTSEPLYGLMVVVVLVLTSVWMRGERARPPDQWSSRANVRRAGGSGMLGVLGGFATLVRAEFLICALTLGFLHWRSGIRTGSSRLAGAAYLLGFCLALAPTTLWHWQSVSAFNASRAGRIAGPLPRFAPVTSYGAFNFAMANHADADGGPNRDHPLLVAESPSDDSIPAEAGLDFASPAAYELYVHGYRIGLRWLLDNPGEGLALAWRKIAMTSGVFAYGYLQDDIPAGVDGTRRRVDQLDPSRRVLWPIHVVLVLAGARLLRRRGDERLLLAAPLLALASSSLMFFGYVRLGVAYLPIFWILQGTALAALAAKRPRPPRGPQRGSRAGVARRATDVAIRGEVSASVRAGGGAPAPVKKVKASESWRRRTPVLLLLAAALLLVVEAVGTRRARLVAMDGPRDADGAIVQDETIEVRRVQ